MIEVIDYHCKGADQRSRVLVIVRRSVIQKLQRRCSEGGIKGIMMHFSTRLYRCQFEKIHLHLPPDLLNVRIFLENPLLWVEKSLGQGAERKCEIHEGQIE